MVLRVSAEMICAFGEAMQNGTTLRAHGVPPQSWMTQMESTTVFASAGCLTGGWFFNA
jgi:hypothetical protein